MFFSLEHLIQKPVSELKTEDIALKESLSIYLLHLACDKTCPGEDLIKVISDMIAIVKTIPGRTLDTSDILKQRL